MAADINAIFLAELEHGVREGVVLLSRGPFVAVPLELVSESCDCESFGEPILVDSVVDDEFVNDSTNWKISFILF